MASKMVPKSIRKRCQHALRFRSRFFIKFLAPRASPESQKVCSRLGAVPFFIYVAISFFIRFGYRKTSKIGSKMDPKSSQSASQNLLQKVMPKMMDFRIDLGAILAPKSAPFLQIWEGDCVAHPMFYRLGRCSGVFWL